MNTSGREFAFSFLRQYEKERGHVQLRLPKALSDSNLDRRERAFVTELVYGVLRSKLSLDWLISEFSSKKTASPDSDTKNVLRLGLYQLLYLDRVPNHAAVDTTVEIAKTHLHPSVVKFVNAVLRGAGRAKNQLPWPDRDKNEALFLSVFYSHPRWLVDFWLKELGVKTTEALLAADNERPKVTLRVNTLKTSKSDLVEVLGGYDIRSEEGQLCDEAVIIKSFIPDSIISKGLVYAQNEASIAVGHIVEPSAGQTVIDLCAGPGGKTTHLAQLMENRGKIIAVDASADRLSLIDQNSRRLGTSIIELVKGDATERLSLESADNVLVDAPCTGLGVLARRPDSRWHKRREDIARLADLQVKILLRGADYVKEGGFLTYSVCTITKAETVGVVELFRKQRPDFEPVPIRLKNRGEVDVTASIQLQPYEHNTDGMFVARFQRRL